MKWVSIAANIFLVVLLVVVYLRPHRGDETPFQALRIVFVAVGNLRQEYPATMYEGIKAAERDFGCQVRVLWSGWSEHGIRKELRRAIAMQPHAICVPGHPDENALAPLVRQAIDSGIQVTSYHTTLPKLQREYRAQGFGFAGHDQEKAGRRMARRAIAKFDLQAGDRVLVFATRQAEYGVRSRPQASYRALKEAGIDADLMDMRAVWAVQPRHTLQDVFMTHWEAKPPLKCVIFDAGEPEHLVKVLKRVGIKPDDLGICGYGLSNATLDYLETGYVDILHDQQPYFHAYFAILQVCHHQTIKTPGLNLYTGAGLIEKDDVAALRKLVEAGLR